MPIVPNRSIRARPYKHHCLIGGLLALACLCSVPAQAAKGGTESREALASKARKACLAGDIQSGMGILSELFVQTKDPTYIYNQGRCFEQNGKYEEAVSRFEEFLRLTKGTANKDRAAAEEHLAECQGKLTKIAAIVPPPAPPPVIAPAPATPEPVVPAIESTPVASAESNGRGLRIAGITAGAVGVAALAGGLAFNLMANKLTKDLNSKGGYDQDKASTRSTYATLTWVGYGVGGACLVGGAILYYLGSRTSEPSTVALLPSLAPGQAGMSLQGAF